MNLKEIQDDKFFSNTKDKREIAIIKYNKKTNKIFCWVNNSSGYEYKMYLEKIDPLNVIGGESELLRMNIWNELPLKTKNEIKELDTQNSQNEMTKFKNRKKKYPEIPKEIKCIQCGKKQKMSASILGKKLEEKNILIEDYVKNFKCQKCNPTKGRKRTSRYAGIPKEINCSICKKTTNVSQSKVMANCNINNLTLNDYINSFKCKKCKK